MRLSEAKKERISEQILDFLYSLAPKAVYTSNIAAEIARDEEFVKILLADLKKKGLVIGITKNSNGEAYSRRIRWKISDNAYGVYRQKQSTF